MMSRIVRPMATLTDEIDPGPRAQTPLFIPISFAIGPLTITTGACGPVDHRQDNRHGVGLGARHDRVRGNLLDGANAKAGRENAHHLIGRASRRGDHGVNLGSSRWHEGHPVAETALDELAIHLIEALQEVVARK
jgi:hypothetical protein